MKAMLATELRRMLARPLVRAVAAAVIAAAVIAGVGVFLASHKDTIANLRSLEAGRQAAIERCVSSAFNPPLSSIAADDRREFCASEGVPGPPFTFYLTQLTDILEGVEFKGSAEAFVILGFLLGATFVGAEWQSGTMTTVLGWEPGRLRVLAAKTGIAATVVVVGVVAGQIVLGSALSPAAVFKGTVEGANAVWLLDVAGAAARVAVVSALAAVAGVSLAMIGRNTAAALGAGFVYALVEVFIRGFDNPAWQRWLVGENAGIFVTGRAPAPPSPEFSPSIALVLLVVSIGAIFVVATASFLKRDAS